MPHANVCDRTPIVRLSPKSSKRAASMPAQHTVLKSMKERKIYARCQACNKGALASKAPPRVSSGPCFFALHLQQVTRAPFNMPCLLMDDVAICPGLTCPSQTAP